MATKVSFQTFSDQLIDEVRKSNWSGFDVEMKVYYGADEEGADRLYVSLSDAPVIKFTLRRSHDGKDVKMVPYATGIMEDDDENL